MPDPKLTARIMDYVERQNSYFEEMLRDLTTLPDEVDTEDVEQLAEKRAAQDRQVFDLERELSVLLPEWESSETLSEQERANVRTQTERGEELIAQLAAATEQADAAVKRRMEELNQEILSLRRSSSGLSKYKPKEVEGSRYMDETV